MKRVLLSIGLVILIIVSFRFSILWGLLSGHTSLFDNQDSETNVMTFNESGQRDTVNYELDAFKKLDVSRAIDVTVYSSDEYKVILSVNERLADDVIVKVDGDTLKMSVKNSIDSIFSNEVSAEVYMPIISEIDLSSASDMTIDEDMAFEDHLKMDVDSASKLILYGNVQKADIEVGGASDLYGSIQADEMKLEIHGASKAEIEGYSDRLDLDLSGASDANMDQFEANELKADISGASKAHLVVRESLESEVSGASDLLYEGNPSLKNISTDVSSQLRQVN